jgi:hypothetical protein
MLSDFIRLRALGQFLVVRQDAILQQVVNPRSLRRLAIGAQVTNLPYNWQDLIVPAFRKHAGQMKSVFSELSPEELRALEEALPR